MTFDPPSRSDAGDGYSFTYDAAEGDQPTLTIIEAVAWVSGVDVLDLNPLQRTIDTEYLNREFSPGNGGDFYRSAAQVAVGGPRLTFEYEGYTLTVTERQIHIEE